MEKRTLNRRRFLAETGRAIAAAGLTGGVLNAQAKGGEIRMLDDTRLLDDIQKRTLSYFTDFAEPKTGMARETDRTDGPFTPDIVAVGGTGFGVMSLVSGVSRGWVAREDAVKQIQKMTDFLSTAEHHHGIFPHWLNAKTGKNFHFRGSKDDGADVVETSFLMMGLLTARQYFDGDDPNEKKLRESINEIWHRADWKWHTTHGKENVLMWHWSPQHEWDLNLPIKGWNEALVTYVVAASSPTHPIDKDTYIKGWGAGDEFQTNHKTHDITIPFGPPGGGPLFISQYSFQGLDPKGLQDRYGDYEKQVVAHTLANRQHCIENPFSHKGYSEKCWGLTSSFNDRNNGEGYDAHSPTHDLGIITPTAALSSMAFTPKESMQFLRHVYEDRPQDKVMGKYGLVDAFKADGSWYAKAHLAIDQGPIVNMIENHRSGLLWKLFMRAPEIQHGLKKLEFKSPHLDNEQDKPHWQKQVSAPVMDAKRER